MLLRLGRANHALAVLLLGEQFPLKPKTVETATLCLPIQVFLASCERAEDVVQCIVSIVISFAAKVPSTLKTSGILMFLKTFELPSVPYTSNILKLFLNRFDIVKSIFKLFPKWLSIF